MSCHPTLGRFVQRDPLGYVDGGGLYEYQGGNPLIRLDAKGTEYEWLFPGERDPNYQRTRDLPAYNDLGTGRTRREGDGWSLGAEAHFFLGAGLTRVNCSRNGQNVSMLFAKICFAGAIGVGGGVQVVSMASCDAANYSGLLYEVGLSAGVVGVGYDQGYNDNGTTSDTWEAGGSIGFSPGVKFGMGAKSTWCYYVLVDEIVTCP